MAALLCFGNLQFDILCREVVSLPAPGEIRPIASIDFALSGNAGSMSAVLARLGIAVDIAGYCGADMIGEHMRRMLEEVGVGTEKLLRHPTAGTGTSVITLAPGGERSILIVNGANDLIDLEAVPDAWLQDVELLVVQSVFLLPQFTGERIRQLFARARARNARTLLNICWDGAGRGLAFLKPALEETDYFVLNNDEGRQLTGQSEPTAILAALRSHTKAALILTLGPQGCCVQQDGQVTSIPALPVEAVDSTGAGDSFIAGLCAGLLTGRSLSASARLGCVTASFAVTGPGAYPRTPSLAEISQRFGV